MAGTFEILIKFGSDGKRNKTKPAMDKNWKPDIEAKIAQMAPLSAHREKA